MSTISSRQPAREMLLYLEANNFFRVSLLLLTALVDTLSVGTGSSRWSGVQVIWWKGI